MPKKATASTKLPTQFAAPDVPKETEEINNEVIVTIKPSKQSIESLAQAAADSLAEEESIPDPVPVKVDPTETIPETATVVIDKAKTAIQTEVEEPVAVRVATPVGSKRTIKPLTDKETETTESISEEESSPNESVGVKTAATKPSVSAFDTKPTKPAPTTSVDAVDEPSVMRPVDASFDDQRPAALNQTTLNAATRDYKISKKNLKHPPKAIRQQHKASLTQIIIVVTTIYLVAGALYLYADRYGIIG